MPSTTKPRAIKVTLRSCQSRTTARSERFSSRRARGIVAKLGSTSAIAAAISSSTRSGGSSEAAAKPPTVPISVIAPRAPEAAPHALRGTTSGSSA